MPQLTGTETLQLTSTLSTGGPAAESFTATTNQIAALSLATLFFGEYITTVTATGNTTISAFDLAGGYIYRNGALSNFIDTSDTAVNIWNALAAVNIATPGMGIPTLIKNNTPFVMTLVGGVGVNIVGPPTIPANATLFFLMTVNSPTSTTFSQFLTSTPSLQAESATALNTVGGAVISGAGIAGRVVNRGGAQSNTPFTDVTDSATNIAAAAPNAGVGTAWEFTYVNNTNATATIASGTNVTVSIVTVIPANSFARYLVTYSASTPAFTMAAITNGNLENIFNGTFTAAGTAPVTVSNTNLTANSIIAFGLKTVGGTPAAPFVKTVTPTTGFTVASAVGDTSTYNYSITG